MGDHKYYYDFDSEIGLRDWEIINEDEKKTTIRKIVTDLVGRYVFLYPATCTYFPELLFLSVNGDKKRVTKRDAMYIDHDYARYGIEIELKEGKNELIAELSINESNRPIEETPIRLAAAEAPPKPFPFRSKIHPYSHCDFSYTERDVSLIGFAEGVGRINSPGRFGFTKGDGLLDSAMPALGVVDKMFICGQPKYKKNYRWSYSLLPEGMPLHSSYEPRDIDIDDDEIKVNHLSVYWAAMHEGKKFACTYSLAAPAILTEREDARMRLSGLRYAGNYQSILIPRKNGIEECAIDTADISNMAENWLMLFNSTEFPDIPIMLIFDRNPEKLTVTRDKLGRLLSLDFEGTPLMLSLTPFGIERFEPGQMPTREAIKRAEFWSRAALAYPVRETDYFKINEEEKTVTIIEKFEYRYIKDSWGTVPLETAALPPPLSICKTAICPGSRDFLFPTKYGHLWGALGKTAEYIIPMMPTERKFPFRSADSEISSLLSEDLEDFEKFLSQFPDNRLSYPFSGALIEPFAYTSTLSFFMNQKDREFFRSKLQKSLKNALSDTTVSDYAVISWRELMTTNPDRDALMKIYNDEKMKYFRFRNHLVRIEPFTAAKFYICYINVGNISSGRIKTGSEEEILGLKIPLIENDWGAGLTFYYTYLASLAVGSFNEVKKNWPRLKNLYSFFDLFHDFACMATGYSDEGTTWVEGANYGVFTSFIQMAEIVGDKESRDFAIYNAAKQFALRLAVINAGPEFFPKYFETDPWYTVKAFREEAVPYSAFQNYPNLCHDLRSDSLYAFTTEGLYPEAFSGFRMHCGESYNAIMNKTQEYISDFQSFNNPDWGVFQPFASLLTDRVLDSAYPLEKARALIEYGHKNGILMQEWRGIHIFSRALPKNWFRCQLLAWLEMRKHKIWLELWEETVIDEAVYENDTATIYFTHSKHGPMKMKFGISESPKMVTLNGEKITFSIENSEKLIITPNSDGILKIHF